MRSTIWSKYILSIFNKSSRYLEVMKLAILLTPSSVYMSRTPFFTRGQIYPTGNENMICTMVKYEKRFYGRHTALNTSCIVVKYKI